MPGNASCRPTGPVRRRLRPGAGLATLRPSNDMRHGHVHDLPRFAVTVAATWWHVIIGRLRGAVVTNGEIPGSCGLVPEMTAMISQMANLRAAVVAAIGGTSALRALLTRPQARSLASARQAPVHSGGAAGQSACAASPAAARLGHLQALGARV